MQQPRQQYGLGSFVKKAFKGVKKVFKSPLGKAAILGGLGMYGMGAGPFSGIKGAGFLKNLMSKGTTKGIGGFANKWLNPFNKMNPLLYSKNKLGEQVFSGKKAFGLGALGLVAAPFIQKKLGYGPYQDEEVEEADWSVTPGSISNIVSMARAQDPSLNFLPSSAYTQSGFYGADGGVVGLANGGNPGEAQMEQMLRAEYLKYRNQGGTMPYEQFKMLVMKQAQQGQTPNQMMAANGGRAGFENGEMVEQQTDLIEGPQGGEEFQETVVEGQEQPSREQLEALAMHIFQLPLEELDEQQLLVVYQESMQGQPMEEAVQEQAIQFAANGGRIGYFTGALADTKEGKAMSPGTSVSGGLRHDGPVVNEPVVSGGNESLTVPDIDIDGIRNNVQDMNLRNILSQRHPSVVEEDDVPGNLIADASTGSPYTFMQDQILTNAGYDPNEVAGWGNNEGLSLINTLQLNKGGRVGFKYGGSDDDDEDVLNQSKAMSMYRTRRQEGGLMDLGGQEKDYRDNGGFVALGGEERADDVPARLSKNEFVFTADAVRAAGGGNIDAGSEVMQNVMDNLEQGGEISEESQGQNPAQGMYDNYEQLQSRVG